MTATAEPPAATVEAPATVRLDRAQGVELLGPVHGCGYRDGVSLVRRGDGQMVQLGPLMYALLECLDGRRDAAQLADAVSERLGRRLQGEHVTALARKLAAQGLLAGTEHLAPPKRNPLLALRWKILVTDPTITRRLTAPFVFLFRPWVMWPVLAAFCAVFWFVLIHKGVASATSEAFHNPGLLVLVFALAVASAGFHELGHAAACRYGGATPGGMGVGLYLVWPAFYTEVTDAYRLPKRDRLRVDLGGLYFNTVVAVVTMGVWLVWRADALLLVVALQILQMVKQLSPIIRADGYHILSDATGVPDLFTQMGPTLRRLLPGHRHEPSALTGRARLLVTAWVLIVVPVLISLSLSAILLLPRLATSAYDSGRVIATAIPHQVGDGQVIDVLASLVRLLALALPVFGCVLVMQKIVRTTVGRARSWSAGRPVRRGVALSAGGLAVAAVAWAWWPSGQYQPVRPTQNGTIGGMVQLVSTPAAVARPVAVTTGPGAGAGAGAGHGQVPAAPPHLTPGTHLAVTMIPIGGATKRHPALFVIPGGKGKPPVAIVLGSSPAPPALPAAGASTSTTPAASTSATSTSAATPTAPSPTPATAFPFQLPSAPGPGGTQALAENTTDGGVTYDVAYSLVTISGGAPVTNTNSAYALAHCRSCTTVAVSFQVVLVVGRSKDIAPIDAAGALNYECPACTTTAIADQIVVTLKSQPSAQLLAQLQSALKQLNALPSLGAGGTPSAVAAQVADVQQQIDTQLQNSGLLANPPKKATTSATASGTATTTSTAATTPSTATPPAAGSPATTTSAAPSTAGQPTTTAPTSSPAPSSTTTTTSATTSATTTAPASAAAGSG